MQYMNSQTLRNSYFMVYFTHTHTLTTCKFPVRCVTHRGCVGVYLNSGGDHTSGVWRLWKYTLRVHTPAAPFKWNVFTRFTFEGSMKTKVSRVSRGAPASAFRLNGFVFTGENTPGVPRSTLFRFCLFFVLFSALGSCSYSRLSNAFWVICSSSQALASLCDDSKPESTMVKLLLILQYFLLYSLIPTNTC